KADGSTEEDHRSPQRQGMSPPVSNRRQARDVRQQRAGITPPNEARFGGSLLGIDVFRNFDGHGVAALFATGRRCKGRDVSSSSRGAVGIALRSLLALPSPRGRIAPRIRHVAHGRTRPAPYKRLKTDSTTRPRTACLGPSARDNERL